MKKILFLMLMVAGLFASAFSPPELKTGAIMQDGLFTGYASSDKVALGTLVASNTTPTGLMQGKYLSNLGIGIASKEHNRRIVKIGGLGGNKLNLNGVVCKNELPPFGVISRVDTRFEVGWQGFTDR